MRVSRGVVDWRAEALLFKLRIEPVGLKNRVDIFQSHWLNTQSPSGVGSTWIIFLLDVRRHTKAYRNVECMVR